MMMYIGFSIIAGLCAISYGPIYSQQGLSALLQQSGKNSSTTVSSKNSGLSALLVAPKTSSSLATDHAEIQAKLLQQFTTIQSTPLYTKAMSILSDAALQSQYSNTLLSIQLFFMQYATQDLNALSKQSGAARNPSLSALLDAVVSTSASPSTSSGVNGLSLLLSHSQGAGQLGTKAAIKNSVSGLVQQLGKQGKATPVVKQSSTGLQNLLDAVSSTTQLTVHAPVAKVVTSPKSKTSLSTLLAA